ncbi:MAG TPA: YerC/YecD family TrpR-related protein [Clostridia bacterium]|nr:YerC/YecD family TrpR-related protein [Clostridia bacterium]
MTYESKLSNTFMDQLFDAVLLLESREECYRFFEDICTIKELQSISQRLQVAKLLKDNNTYHEIEEITGASTATISRVNRCIQYGAEGYNIVLDRIKKVDEKEY